MRRTHLACEDAPLVRKLCCRDVGSSAAVCRHCHRTLHIAERVARARGMCLGRKTCRRLSRTRASRSRNALPEVGKDTTTAAGQLLRGR
mmetsp:Transcript_30375/g.91077  ORF Transcript_30375/g.91077 Transcript_30375/m.91077 type:complete len:89 (-) Transcript_30375:1024-1290(-)